MARPPLASACFLTLHEPKNTAVFHRYSRKYIFNSLEIARAV